MSDSFPATPWLIGGALLLVVGAIAGLAYKVWKDKHVPWKYIPNYYPGARWHSLAQTDPRFLSAALQYAESVLIAHTTWNAANLALVGHHVRVMVKESEAWVDLWGRKVAGYEVGHMLVVGPSLAALCHELAHLCEKVLLGGTDHTHEGWGSNGVTKALVAYDDWLASQHATSRVLPDAVAGIVPLSLQPTLHGMSACRFWSP